MQAKPSVVNTPTVSDVIDFMKTSDGIVCLAPLDGSGKVQLNCIRTNARISRYVVNLYLWRNSLRRRFAYHFEKREKRAQIALSTRMTHCTIR
jgi:hypothetical protein